MLVLSGGIDPATPPRHGERVVRALGPMARHVVVANAGHGVLGIGCVRDVVFRFIDASADRDALAVDAGCAAAVPRPPAFRPVGRPQGDVSHRSWRDDRGPRRSPSRSPRRRASADGGWRACARSLGKPAARRGDGASASARVHAVATSASTRPNGRITGLLGPNGAGKTTTLRMLAALITPDAGTMRVDGIDVVARPREVLARMGVLSDARGLYPRLTARENIVYYGALHGMEREAAEARAEDLARMFDMTRAARPARRRLQPGRADEDRARAARSSTTPPTSSSTSRPTASTCSRRAPCATACAGCARPRAAPKCIVFSTHIMQEVERLCDSVVVVAHGRTVATGTVAELLAETGERDFEEAFVKLAFVPERAGAEAAP